MIDQINFIIEKSYKAGILLFFKTVLFLNCINLYIYKCLYLFFKHEKQI